MNGPLKAAGSGSKGFELRIEDAAAKSSGLRPEVRTNCGSDAGTEPSFIMRNSSTTMPFSPSRADSGITAYQLRRTLASTRFR